MDREYESMAMLLPQIKNFEVLESDVFVLGYPKAGSTWCMEMVWLIVNDLNFHAADDVSIVLRCPTLELSGFKVHNPNIQPKACRKDSIGYINNMANPRVVRSHLPPDKLPEQLLIGEKKAKIIYVARDVKDLCLSLYHFTKNLVKNHNLSLEDFCITFLAGYENRIMGNYWKHVLYFWERRNEQHVLFIKYEEMKNDTAQVIQRVAKFLNKTVTKEQELELAKWIDFETMKNRTAVNCTEIFHESGFIRVGKVGEHKKDMSPEIIEKFDLWSKKYLKDSDYENRRFLQLTNLERVKFVPHVNKYNPSGFVRAKSKMQVPPYL